jgi:large subunit ribosomal protein L25
VLLQGITEIEIECLPGDLIDAIEVDISSLTELDQELTVAGLTVPPGIEILTEPHEMVVRVIRAPEEEEIEEEEILISPAEVEVIRGPRREEEIEEAEEGPLAESF